MTRPETAATAGAALTGWLPEVGLPLPALRHQAYNCEQLVVAGHHGETIYLGHATLCS